MKTKSQRPYRLLLSAILAFGFTVKAATVWSTSFEDGTINAFFLPGISQDDSKHGGGVYSSGSAWHAVTSAFGHTGSRSLQLTIATPSSPTSGVRMFRWQEAQLNQTLIYTAWFYLPQSAMLTQPPAGQFFNIMDWKSKDPSDGRVKTFVTLELYNRGQGGNLQLAASNNHADGKLGSVTTYYQQSPGMDWPVAQWVKVQAIHACSRTDGHIAVLVNDTRLLDLDVGQNSFADIGANGCQWATQLYSNGLSPNPATMYIDDLSIDTVN